MQYQLFGNHTLQMATHFNVVAEKLHDTITQVATQQQRPILCRPYARQCRGAYGNGC